MGLTSVRHQLPHLSASVIGMRRPGAVVLASAPGPTLGSYVRHQDDPGSLDKLLWGARGNDSARERTPLCGS